MEFAVGDAVLVLALNRRGEVVERRGRVCRVAVGGLMLTCRPDELRPADSRDRGKRRKPSGHPPVAVAAPGDALPTTAGTTSTIDLHGMTTQEAREALLRHLDVAMRAGHATVEVVHGIGTGKVRKVVADVAAAVPSVRHAGRHPANPGVTLIFL